MTTDGYVYYVLNRGDYFAIEKVMTEAGSALNQRVCGHIDQ